jgi:hypothetical protein
MSDRSHERRQFAAQCLWLAQRTSDVSVRASLIDMAQKWLEFAGKQYGDQVLRDVVGEFNLRQLLDIGRAA